MKVTIHIPSVSSKNVDMTEIEKLIEAIKESASVNVMDNSDLLRELKISPRTAQTWRDTGILPYSMVGRKIYYKTSDVQELLNRTRIDNKV